MWPGTCSRFVTLHRGRQFITVLYLAGIRYFYIRKGFNDPTANKLRLFYVLRGIQKSQVNIKKTRLPITFHILKEMCDLLKKGVFGIRTDLMLQCVFQMAFFGFMRCAEFTAKSTNDMFIRISDISVQDNFKYTVFLRTSKCDPFSKGVYIDIFNNNSLCPVIVMNKYLSIRRCYSGANIHSPLFVEFGLGSRGTGNILCRDRFIYYLRHLLTLLGCNDNDYCGHSFRIGAATSAGAAGVPDHIIKMLGRWTSDCYVRYIHTDSKCIRQAQVNMCALDSTYNSEI